MRILPAFPAGERKNKPETPGSGDLVQQTVLALERVQSLH